jgi:hypothetical protein
MYIAPQTEAIVLLVENAIMASSGYLDPLSGFGSGSGTGDMM